MREKQITEIQKLAKSVAELAQPDMRPKELREAVREKFPDASKKEIARAAFYAVILAAQEQPSKAKDLHKLALKNRNDPVEDSQKKSRKKSEPKGKPKGQSEGD
jgi:hypothetical protein